RRARRAARPGDPGSGARRWRGTGRGGREGDCSSRARGLPMRSPETRDGLGLAEDCRHLEDGRARCLGGELDAGELRAMRELAPPLRGESAIETLQAVRVEGVLHLYALDEGRVAGGRLRAPELRDGLRVVARRRLEVEGGLLRHLQEGMRA